MHQPEREIIQPAERSLIETVQNRALALAAAGALALSIGGENAQAQRSTQPVTAGENPVEFASRPSDGRATLECRNVESSQPRVPSRTNRGESTTNDTPIITGRGVAASIIYYGSNNASSKRVPLNPANRKPKSNKRQVCDPDPDAPRLTPAKPNRRPLSTVR